MHACAEVWIPTLGNVEEQIEQIMAPHREDYDDGKSSGFWDWFQIGGRYTGNHLTSYDPAKDPRNWETCNQCGGTGFRSDDLGRKQRATDPSYTCNGCGESKDGKWTHGPRGVGRALKWPTNWVRFEGDVLPVVAAPADLKSYTLIANGRVLHKQEWNGKDYVETDFDGSVMPALEKLGVKDGFLVTVDYHS